MLVVLSIAVGVFAIGMVVGLNEVLSRNMAESWASINPVSARLYPAGFDEDLVRTVRRMPEVRDAEGQRTLQVRLHVAPGSSLGDVSQWKNLLLYVLDYSGNRINRVHPEQGAWPPAKGEIVIERASLAATGANLGDMLLVETPEEKQRELRLAGVAHSIAHTGPTFDGIMVGFVTFDTLEWLGQTREMNELKIIVADPTNDKAQIERIVSQISAKVEKSGRIAYFRYVPRPGEHPAKFLIDAMMALLGVLSFLALGLSAFLIVNTITALLAQQVRQIGVQKAIGARASQLLGMYLVLVLALGLLALLIALPLSAIATYGLAAWVASMINFEFEGAILSPQMILSEVAVAILTPLLAAFFPVLAGTRTTIREAISNYGLSASSADSGLIDRLAGRIHGLSRPLLLSLHNTFRRKGRLALTLTTLTLAGTLFISVVNVKDSLALTTDDIMRYNREDVTFNVGSGHRFEEVEQEVLAIPGVARVEGSVHLGAKRIRPDGTESNSVVLIAPAAGTELTQPIILQGRWLLPEDENAIVLGNDFLRVEPDVRVGDDITLKIWDRKTTWRVVGISLTIGAGNSSPVSYANGPYVARALNIVGIAGQMRVVTASHDPTFQDDVAKELEARLKRAGVRIDSVYTYGGSRQRIANMLEPIIIFLMMMAVILGVVGGIGLTGTMMINVMERTREIGVLRAVGASNRAVQQMVVVEGVVIGVMSWIGGTILAVPISRLLDESVGMGFLQAPLRYTFSISGVMIWLCIVVVLSGSASFLPAWNASRISVRQALAYE